MTKKPPGKNEQKPKPADENLLLRAREWIDSAIPPGSSRYYAILHTDRHAQTQSQAITALIRLWSRLAFHHQDPQAALRQIDWWQEELSRERCEHPLSQLLEKPLTDKPVLLEQLQEILSGYAELLMYGSPSTDEANKLFHWSTGALPCLALTDTENSVNNPVARAGVALSRFRCLRYLPDHVNAKLLCLPLSALNANGLSPAQLQPGSEDPNLLAFFKQQLQVLNTEMDSTATDLLSAGTRTRPLYIYLRSQQQLLRKLLQGDANLLRQPPVQLSPLRNYFIAFKAARQHYRHN